MFEQFDALTKFIGNGLIEAIVTILNESLAIQRKLLKLESRTGEVRQRRLLEELEISPATLDKWEKHGLKRIERGGVVTYNVEELNRFNY